MTQPTMTGMEIEAVRSLARTMDARADEIDQLVASTSGVVSGMNWRGADRERFVGEWNGTHVSRLRRLSAGLRDAAERARQKAAQQERISRAH